VACSAAPTNESTESTNQALWYPEANCTLIAGRAGPVDLHMITMRPTSIVFDCSNLSNNGPNYDAAAFQCGVWQQIHQSTLPGDWQINSGEYRWLGDNLDYLTPSDLANVENFVNTSSTNNSRDVYGGVYSCSYLIWDFQGKAPNMPKTILAYDPTCAGAGCGHGI
jgi:hypothetical protein